MASLIKRVNSHLRVWLLDVDSLIEREKNNEKRRSAKTRIPEEI